MFSDLLLWPVDLLLPTADTSQTSWNPIAGTVLDSPLFGPVKLWMAIATMLMWKAWGALKRGAFGGGKQVSASHILVKEESACEEIKKQMMKARKDDVASR